MASIAPSLLQTWRAERGLDRKAAAAFLRVSTTAYWNYERGRTTPRAEIMFRIAELTANAVPAASWVPASKVAA